MGFTPLPAAVIFHHSVYQTLEPTLKTQQAIDMADYGGLCGDWYFFQPFDFMLQQEQTRAFVQNLSGQHGVALLYYFNNAEGMGMVNIETDEEYGGGEESWGFTLFDRGETVGSMCIRHDLAPWEDGFTEHIASAAKSANIAGFASLGVSEDARASMISLLTPEAIEQRLETDEMLDIAGAFQEILGINEVFQH